MKRNKAIVKFLMLAMLWAGGINICQATDVDCFTGTLWNEELLDTGTPTEITCCQGGNTHCYFEGGVYVFPKGHNAQLGDVCAENPSAIPCGPKSMPLTDASSLLVFMLGIYGIYLYRKRRVANKI